MKLTGRFGKMLSLLAKDPVHSLRFVEQRVEVPAPSMGNALQRGHWQWLAHSFQVLAWATRAAARCNDCISAEPAQGGTVAGNVGS